VQEAGFIADEDRKVILKDENKCCQSLYTYVLNNYSNTCVEDYICRSPDNVLHCIVLDLVFSIDT